MRLLGKIAGMAALGSVLPSVAFAFVHPVPVPEPATMTLVATGLGTAGGFYLIGKWLRRK